MSTDPLEEVTGDEVVDTGGHAPPVIVILEPPKPMDEGPVLPPGFIWDNSSGRFKKAPAL